MSDAFPKGVAVASFSPDCAFLRGSPRSSQGTAVYSESNFPLLILSLSSGVRSAGNSLVEPSASLATSPRPLPRALAEGSRLRAAQPELSPRALIADGPRRGWLVPVSAGAGRMRFHAVPCSTPKSVSIFTSTSKSCFRLFLKPMFVIKYFIIMFPLIFAFVECVHKAFFPFGRAKSLNRVLEASTLQQSPVPGRVAGWCAHCVSPGHVTGNAVLRSQGPAASLLASPF